jgi:hypothetical protein
MYSAAPRGLPTISLREEVLVRVPTVSTIMLLERHLTYTRSTLLSRHYCLGILAVLTKSATNIFPFFRYSAVKVITLNLCTWISSGESNIVSFYFQSCDSVTTCDLGYLFEDSFGFSAAQSISSNSRFSKQNATWLHRAPSKENSKCLFHTH